MAATQIDLYDGKYFYTLPKEPSDEKMIIGHDLKKKDQYWRTPQFPDEFTWKRMTTIQQYEIVSVERERFMNGVWFMNNGVPTYITGMHYDHLTNATFDFGKASYFDSHRLDFYWREYVRNDPRCYGQCTIKPRRYGYSLQEITQQTWEAMQDFSRKLGMMSNNKDKTYESLFNPLVESYIQRPQWVRPDIYMPNNKIPKMKLWWNSGSVKKTDSYQYDTRGNLNTTLIPKPTTVMGYDGNKLHYLTLDEAWKWTLANPYDCWKKQRPTLHVGTTIVGKCSVLSTMGDDDDYDEAIVAGIQMFLESDPTARDDNGHTKTGLYHRFISGEYSLFDYADAYGFINLDQAQTFIHNSRKTLTEGSTEWVYEVRRYPLTLEEAISTANGVGIFDNKRLDVRINILEKSAKTTMGSLFEDPKGKVIFEPGNNGDWEWYKLPKITTSKDYSNRWFKDPMEETIQLRNNPQGVLGYDPVRYAVQDTISKSISMAAIVGFQKFDYYGNGGANQIQCLYHARPDDPEVAHYECFKAAKFTGWKIAVERQVESMLRRMRELNAVDLMLVSQYDGKLGFWSTPKTLKDAIDLIQAFFKKPKTVTDIDNIMMCEFIKVLQQAKIIKPGKMTPYDIIMALIEAFLGAVNLKETVEDDNYTNKLNSILELIQPQRTETWKDKEHERYSNMGNRLEQE